MRIRSVGVFLAALLFAALPLAPSRAIESQTLIVSDDVTALTQGTGLFTWRMKGDFILTEVRAELTMPQASGAPVTIDIQTGGVSYFSSLPSIPNGTNSSYGSTTPGVISNNKIPDETPLSFNVQIGDGTAKGLKITLMGYSPPSSKYVNASAPPPPPPPPPPPSGITVTPLGNGISVPGTSNAKVTGATVPAGSTVLVAGNENCSSVTGMSVTDSAGNAYTPVTLVAGAGNLCYGFFVSANIANPLSSGTITFNQHSINDGATVTAWYLTGTASSPLDTAVTNTATGSSTSPSVTSGTPGQSGEMFIGVAWGAACNMFTQASTWSNINSQVCYNNAFTEIGEGSLSNSGTGTMVFNPSWAASQGWAAGIYGFKHP